MPILPSYLRALVVVVLLLLEFLRFLLQAFVLWQPPHSGVLVVFCALEDRDGRRYDLLSSDKYRDGRRYDLLSSEQSFQT